MGEPAPIREEYRSSANRSSLSLSAWSLGGWGFLIEGLIEFGRNRRLLLECRANWPRRRNATLTLEQIYKWAPANQLAHAVFHAWLLQPEDTATRRGQSRLCERSFIESL